MAEYTGGSVDATHLCVLVHGLWGSPDHMANVAKALRKHHGPETLYIHVAKRNAGSFTYDGIELGGERVCMEIVDELELIRSRGGKIKKFSVVGYSLGGLVARYAIGLLFAKGVLDEVECMNFTAFASPFLGVRTPLRGHGNHIWNALGARTLCMSGRQLFGIDMFRDTGRPLLAVLADSSSIFMSGLARFKHRTLYTNIINDRSAVHYTTGISKTDPYTDLSKIQVNYLKGYEDVILDPVNPFTPLPPREKVSEPLVSTVRQVVGRIPFFLAIAFFLPIGFVTFMVNSLVQTVRSSRRVKLHESGKAGINAQDYRVNLWIKELREAVEDAYENLNSSQDNEYLHLSDDEAPGVGEDARDDQQLLSLERKQSHPGQPTLALAPYQFAAIQALDKLGFRKYPVHIHEARHSHAAIIVRMDKPSLREGYVVLRHWLDGEFLI